MNGPERVTARYLKKAGGSEFSVYAVGTDAKSAFQKAVSEARYESGSGGYSGNIAEKDGFKLRSSDPMTRAQARAFMGRTSRKTTSGVLLSPYLLPRRKFWGKQSSPSQ